MKTWTLPQPVHLPDDFLQVAQGNRIVAETLIRRGISDLRAVQAFLNPDLYQPASPFELPNMEKAVGRVRDAIASGELIGIWGDFDVDGQTATTLLVTALRKLGARVVYTIPMRDEGHGITVDKLAVFLDQGVQLLITCDTGISAHEAVDFARTRGVDVIITDHHKLPETLPDAFACINPQLVPDTHPLHTLPGVGCAYKLVEALYDGREDELEAFLDLVALGIVADVAVQRGDTRYLLQRGLKVLRQTQRLGLRQLMELAELSIEQVNEENIGFALGPRLNAIGRLDDAKMAVEFLSTEDLEQARILANRIEFLNNERRLLSQQVYDAAQKQLEADPSLLNYNVLVLGHPEWPTSVLGIVANRLVEQYHRPAILLTAPQDGLAHGSARSVDGVDITAALASHSHLLTGFGGHMMAAGLRLGTGIIPELRRALSRSIQLEIKPDSPQLHIDGIIHLRELTLDFARQLTQLAPFGTGNPMLVLASQECTLKSHRLFGRQSEHLSLTICDADGGTCELIQWRGGGMEIPQGRFNVAYTVRENVYKGKTELQILLLDLIPLDDQTQFYSPSRVELVDYRAETSPELKLRELIRLYPDLIIWNEGDKLEGIESFKRDQLKKGQRLAVWTVPPAADIFKAALECVAPQEVYLFNKMPDDQMDQFIKRVSGFIKYAINQRDGKIDLEQFAGLLSQRVKVVHKALEWLIEKGAVTILSQTDKEVIVGEGSHSNNANKVQMITSQLQTMLNETAAYRAYFLKAEKEQLLG